MKFPYGKARQELEELGLLEDYIVNMKASSIRKKFGNEERWN